MHNWLRSCYALTLPLAGRLIHSPAAVTVAVILRGSMALAQSAPGSGWEVSANELARKVVANELKFQDEDHAQWMYLWCAKIACDKDSPLRHSPILASQIAFSQSGIESILFQPVIKVHLV